jgi:hypothetical protein
MGLSVVAVELLECQHSELAVILKKLSNDLGSCCWSATKDNLLLHLGVVGTLGIDYFGCNAKRPVQRRDLRANVGLTRQFVAMDFLFVCHNCRLILVL